MPEKLKGSPLIEYNRVSINTNTLYSYSTSTGVGPTNASFYWVKTYFGDGVTTTAVGDFGTCEIPPGPYPNANCTLSSGSGTVADPFVYFCSTPLTLSNCTLPGTIFVLDTGQMDIDVRLYTQTAQVAPVSARLQAFQL
jgi:hypothetical protein